MGTITNFLEEELLDHVFNAAYTAPSNLYLCLCTADPTDAATGASMSEVPDLYAYARTEITFGVAASRQVTQDAEVVFPQASGGAWGTVTHWAIADISTHGSGNVLAHGAFAEGKAVNDGNTPSVANTSLYVQFTADETSDVLANELLDHAFNDAAYSPPDTYIALATAVIAADDTGSTITEPGAGAYARKQVNINGGASPTWDLASASLVDNTHSIDFVTATASWGTIVAMAIVSALTVGDLLFFDNTMADEAVGDGDTVKFPIGDLDITLD